MGVSVSLLCPPGAWLGPLGVGRAHLVVHCFPAPLPHLPQVGAQAEPASDDTHTPSTDCPHCLWRAGGPQSSASTWGWHVCHQVVCATATRWLEVAVTRCSWQRKKGRGLGHAQGHSWCDMNPAQVDVLKGSADLDGNGGAESGRFGAGGSGGGVEITAWSQDPA